MNPGRQNSDEVSLRGEQSAMRWLWVAGLWFAAATWFAWHRSPFDDEWFSIDLALDTDATHFWQALRDDVHPPWLAWFDRFLGSIWASRYPMQGVRLLVSAIAIAITAPWLASRARLPVPVVWLAAFHPIVFMYVGAERWYPLLLLAHALRARALWGYDKPERRSLEFIAGSVAGALAGYVDTWFVLHDSAWWAWRARSDSGSSWRWRAWVMPGVALLCSMGLRWLSPLGGTHRLGFLGQGYGIDSFLIWAGLGCIGEAGPPWPWLLIGLAVPIAFGRALWVGWRNPATRVFCAYLVSTLLAWAVLTPFRVWHPRYSLWIWFALSAWTFVLWRGTLRDRIALGLTACCWALSLGFMVSGHGFYKADANELTDAECEAFRHGPPPDLIVVPYKRLAELVDKECNLARPALRMSSIRMVPQEREQMSGLRAAMARGPRVVTTLELTAQSSLTHTDHRVTTILSETCRSISRREIGDIPHHEIKALYKSGEAKRFVQEVWLCQ